jgi:DNA-binding transcriptional ArsR family regulator
MRSTVPGRYLGRINFGSDRTILTELDAAMSIVFRFRAEDLLQCRFAISPLGETADALRSLVLPGREGYHLRWQRQVRGRLAELGIEPLLSVLAISAYQPDFLNLPPPGPFTEIDGELERVRAIPPERVATELNRSLDGHPAGRAARRAHPELSGDPAQARDLLAAMLKRAWSALVEPWWPQLRDVLDADITFRARQLADTGVSGTLNDLDPKVSWRDGVLKITMTPRAELDVAGEVLVLIPSVFAWPRLAVTFDPPAVTYPARGIATIWQPPAQSDSDLAALIGKTRAAVLTALTEPASTTGLAARCGISVSSASEHLAVLRATGLVATARTGRFLVHQRTPLGVALSGGS